MLWIFRVFQRSHSRRGNGVIELCKRTFVWLILLMVGIVCWASAGDFTGIRGRAAKSGQTLEGVRVFVFGSIEDYLGCRPVAVSEPSNLEGVYQIEVPPGEYWVVGYVGDSSCARPKPGDLFCFYGGNPVVVEEGKPTNVGLSMIEVKKNPAPSGKRGIEGYVFDENEEPLPGAVVYFYRSPSGKFRGIPDYFTRTNKKGKFRARIGKGNYFIMVRKRKTGNIYGPTEIGDRYGYYPGNPLEYDGLSSVAVRIDCVIRLSQLEKFEGFEEVKHGIQINGLVVDRAGNPVKGYYVFAYRGKRGKGMPDAISGRTDEEGNFSLTVYVPGSYTLVAREKPGGPSGRGKTGKVKVILEKGKDLNGVELVIGEEAER